MIARSALRLLALLGLLTTAVPAAAQFGPPGSGNPFGNAAPAFNDSRDHVEVTIAADRTKIERGTEVVVAVVFDHDPGWHIWTNEREIPEDYDVFGGAIHTTLSFASSVDGALTIDGDHLAWPEIHASTVDFGDENGPQRYATFDGRAVVYVPVVVPAEAPLGAVTLTATATFQSCDATTCLRPAFDIEYPLTLEIVDEGAGDAPRTTGDFADVPGSLFDAARHDDGSGHAAAPAITFTDDFGDSRDRVVVTLATDAETYDAGASGTLIVTMHHAPHWHTWPNEGNLPDGLTAYEFATYTTLQLSASSPALTFDLDGATWPQPHAAPIDLGMGDGPQDFATFSDAAEIRVPFTIADDADDATIAFTAEMTFQACDDTTCMFPADGTYEGTVVIGALRLRPSQGEELRSGQADEDENEDEDPEAAGVSFFGLTLPSTNTPAGKLIVALLAIVGGFILNLTPCVLPVIPIKIMTISQHANSPGKSLALGVWMAVGVVAFWFGIGVPAALLTGFADPSRLFSIWWVTLGLGVVIALLSLGMFGAFTLNLPNKVYAVNPKADNALGSFLFGIMTAVLGLPCFGFVAGALLAGAAKMPTLLVLTIFTSIGIGMAAPYLVLAWKPGLVDRIPRTGPASDLVKQVMGLMLVAAGLYFISTGLLALVKEYPYIGGQLQWWAVAIAMAACGIWLIIRTVQITPSFARRAVFSIIGLTLAGFPVLFAMSQTSSAKEIWVKRQEAFAEAGGNASYVTTTWNDYSPAAFAQARADGHVVILDFTADWCINCKALKATVLSPEPVHSEIGAPDTVAFLADVTANSAPGWDKLRELDITGIPQLMVYTPGSDAPWVSGAYTRDQVMTAIANARAGGKVASK